MRWEDHYTHHRGPFGTVRGCRYCRHTESFGRGRGRGYGMREGNKARGRMIEHLKSAHQMRTPDDEPQARQR